MSRKMEAEARKLAQGSGFGILCLRKVFCGPRAEVPRPPPRVPAKVPGVTSTWRISKLLRLRLENDLVKGKGGGAQRTAGCCSW